MAADGFKTPSLSRRNFVRLAVGSLVSLPAVEGGFITPMAQAMAAEAATRAEANGGSAESVTTEITIVAPWELGVYVGDLAEGGKRGIVGATVTLTSRYNQKVLTQQTGNNGTALFDVRELCENLDNLPLDQLTEYSFNGTILVTADGCREFETALVRLHGHDCVLAPTRRIDADADPWPRLISFDEWDALYTASTFVCTPKLDGTRKLRMQWCALWGNGEATLTVRKKGTDTALVTQKATPKNGVLDVTFDKPLLQLGHAEAFEPGASYEVLLSQGGKSAVVDLKAIFQKGEADEETQHNDVYIKPFNNIITNKPSLGNFPAGIPLVGNTQIMEWLPDYYVNVCINPFGYFQITAKTPSWGYKMDSGAEDTSLKKGTWPLGSVAEQMKKQSKKADDMIKKSSTSYSQDGKIRQIQFTKAFEATGNFQLVAIGQWHSDKHYFQGELAGQVFILLRFTLTENFWAGPIPILISFSADMNAIVSLGCGMYSVGDDKASMSDVLFDVSKWKFDYADTGLSVTLNIIPSLSLGVGVEGVMSASVKGKFTLTLYFGLTYRGELDTSTHPLPHVMTGYAAQILVVIKVFLYTRSFNLKNWPYKKISDNWPEGNGQLTAAEDEPLSAMEGMSMEELLSKVNIVTDGMLQKTLEFEGVSGQSVEGASEEGATANAAIDWHDLIAETVEVPLADGTPISYRFIPFIDDDELETQEEGADPVVRKGVRRQTQSVSYTSVHHGTLLSAMDDSNAATGAKLSTLPLPEAEVGELGRYGGVKPTSDVILNKDDDGNVYHVYGDPRIEVVDLTIGMGSVDVRATCSFRIGTVQVDGNLRTRVVLTVLSASDASGEGDVDVEDFVGLHKPIEFEFNGIGDTKHEDYYDYDFGIAFTTRDGKDLVHLTVVSGKRESGDTTAFTTAATDLVVTYFNFKATDIFGSQFEPAAVSMHSNAILTDSDGKYHTISNIRLATDGTDESKSVLIAFLDRSSESRDGTMLEGATAKIGFLFYDLVGSWTSGQPGLFVPNRDKIDEKMGTLDSNSVHELSLSPRIQGDYTLRVTGFDLSTFYVLTIQDEVFSNVRKGTVTGGNTLRLVPWPQRDCFLTSYPDADYIAEVTKPGSTVDPSEWDRQRYVLQKAVWSSDDNPTLSFTSIGPEKFHFSTFALNTSGTFMLWQQGRDGDDGHVYDTEGNVEVNEDTPLYQLMACRIRNERFSDPFVVAEIEHDMDALRIVPTHDRYAPVEVLSNVVVDTGDADEDGLPLYCASDLYYTSVPNLRCATAIGCDADIPLVASGGSLKFNVSIRNDGNSYLSGCTVQLCLHTDQKIDETTKEVISETVTPVNGSVATIAFSESTLVESHWTPKVDDKFTNVESDFALAPGKTATYMALVPIPSDWEGEKIVSFVASNPTVAEGGSLTALEEDYDGECVEFSVGPGEYRIFKHPTTIDTDRNRTHMDTIELPTAVLDSEGVSDNPVTAWDDAATITTATTTTNKSRGAIPQTGDMPIGPLAAGAALAGAALVAYGKRRARNEAAPIEVDDVTVDDAGDALDEDGDR